MGGSIELIRVIVAWPKDVSRERNRLGKIIDEINTNIEDEKGLSIRLISWDTDAIPGLDQNGAQAKIDKNLKIENSDLMIGIFWHRFGTPVKDAESGTEHEIRKAIELWNKYGKPEVMLFFSNASPKLPDIDGIQLEKVRSFKDSIKNTAYYNTYKSLTDFDSKIRRSLYTFVNNYPNKNEEIKNQSQDDTHRERAINKISTKSNKTNTFEQQPNYSPQRISNISDENCSKIIRDRFYKTILELDNISLKFQENKSNLDLHSIWENGFRGLAESEFVNCIKKWHNENPEIFEFDNISNSIILTEPGRKILQKANQKHDSVRRDKMKEQTDKVLDDSFPGYTLLSEYWTCPSCNQRFPSQADMSKHFRSEHR